MRKRISVLVVNEGEFLARQLDKGESPYAGMLTLPTRYWPEDFQCEVLVEAMLYKESNALVPSIKIDKLLELEIQGEQSYLYFAQLVDEDKPLRECLKFVTLEEFANSLAMHDYPPEKMLEIILAIESKL